VQRLFLSLACAAALAAVPACSRGNGTTDTKAIGSVVTVSGCIAQSNGALMLVPAAGNPASPVGTAGRDQPQYRLIDEANTGVQRFVGREATITGKVERAQEEGGNGVPAIRVSSMHGGAECAAK